MGGMHMQLHRILLAIATFVGVGCPATCQETPAGWQLVWQDEFNGDSLDYSKWECEINAFGGGNNELQLYTDRKDNVRVANGSLILEAHKARTDIQGTVRDYSSGRIRSKHRGDWKYGRFEFRAKLPTGQEVWPAIWMLPTDEKYGTWASSGEIDIVEFKGQEPNRIWGTLHYGGTWPNNKHTSGIFTAPNTDFSKDFHLYALEWEEGEIRWYVDQELVQTQKEWSSAGGKFPAPFDQRFYLVLNVAIGGGFVGPVGDKTQFPQQMLVDYARVYQRAKK
jgi:beta-glucanase (GH16 family)